MQMEQQMNEYEPPKVEIIEVGVERGFAASDGNGENMTPTTGYW